MSTSTTNAANLSRGYKAALACAIILSTTAIFIRYLTENYHIPPLVLAFWRDGFTALSLLPVLSVFNPSLLKVKRQHLYYLLIYGFVLAIFNALWTLSVALNGAAISTVLVYCSAAFSALLGWCLLKEELSWVKILVIAISLGGCTLVSGLSPTNAAGTNLPGILVGIISGLSYAGYSLMGRSASQRGLNPWTTLVYTFGFATLFLLFINLLPWKIFPGTATTPAELFYLGNSLTGWGILFLLAAGPTVLGFGLYNVSLVYLPSSVANLIATLEPAFTAVTAYFLLGERLSGIQVIGGLMIMSGVALLRIYEGKIARQTV